VFSQFTIPYNSSTGNKQKPLSKIKQFCNIERKISGCFWLGIALLLMVVFTRGFRQLNSVKRIQIKL